MGNLVLARSPHGLLSTHPAFSRPYPRFARQPVFVRHSTDSWAVASSLYTPHLVLFHLRSPFIRVRSSLSPATQRRPGTFKSRQETTRLKPFSTPIILTLLLIAFVVPMLQFYGYVRR